MKGATFSRVIRSPFTAPTSIPTRSAIPMISKVLNQSV